MRRAGLYLRISKDVRDGAGVERQREDGTRLIAQRDWALHDIYIDNDISAAGHERRPDYQRMLADLDAGVIDAVVSRSFERLCKSRREQLVFVELGQKVRAPVAFTHAPDLDLTTAVGRGIADMMAAWARVEMEQKSERHVSQIAQAAAKGLMVGGRRAFGYTADGMHLNPVEAPILRGMYDQWLTGVDLSTIARKLNTAGTLTPRGNQWRRNSVREVLANPRNAALRGMRDLVDTASRRRAQWHRIIGPAAWPEVVPEATWRAAMDRIHDPDRPGSHHGVYPSRHLLSGLAVCGGLVDGVQCGLTMVSGRREGHRLIRCPSMRHVSRRADYIEVSVEERLLGWLQTPAGRAALGVSTAGSGVDLGAVRSESLTLRARLDGLAGDYADGLLDRTGLRIASERIRARLSDLDRVIGQAGQVSVTAGLAAAEDVVAEWDAYALPQRREIIRRLVRVTVHPGSSGRPGGLRFDPSSVELTWLITV